MVLDVDARPGGAEALNGTSALILLGGCFWGVERALSRLPGVSVEVGYAGGDPAASPTYYNLRSNGHAEAARVVFEGRVPPDRLLEVFLEKSDGDPSPSGVRRYRRAVLCASAGDAAAVREFLRRAARSDMAVEVDTAFFRAEDYHQDYYGRTLGPPD